MLNMYALGSLGSQAECLWGWRRFLVIYFASGVGGSCLAMVVSPEVGIAGASGAIWGLMASLIAWLLLYRQHLPEKHARDCLRRLLVLVVLNGLISLTPGVSWAGHLGGAVVGFFTSGIVGAARPGREWQRWVAVGAVVSILMICVGSLYLQMRRSERWIFLRLKVDTVNRFQYFQQFQQEWTDVHRYKVDTIDRNVVIASAVPALSQRRQADLQQLRANVAAMRRKLSSASSPPRRQANLPNDIEAYLSSLDELIGALEGLLANRNEHDLPKLREKVTRLWESLERIR
jgi:Rhomboid family